MHRDFATEQKNSRICSASSNDTLDNSTPHCCSLLYFTHLSSDNLMQSRHDIVSAAFPSVFVVVHLDKTRDDWQAVRTAVRAWKNYITFDFYFVESSDINLEKLVTLADPDVGQRFSRARESGNSIAVETKEFDALTRCVREPRRRNILSHIPYYKTPDHMPGKPRDLQHLNFLDFLTRRYAFPAEFDGKSLVEIGPGAGFFYRHAQMKKCGSVYIVDKNAGFCTLAESDGAAGVINCDLIEPIFCSKYRQMLPNGVDYVFAKGVLNVYAFKDDDAYTSVVDTVSASIRHAGIWVTYNVDRKNGPDVRKEKMAKEAFEKCGWVRAEIPGELHSLLGLNYLPDVDWAVWLKQ